MTLKRLVELYAELARHTWSLLGYVETLCVDHQGIPDRDRMRCNEHRHPGLIGRCRGMGIIPWKPEYGTRLKGYFLAEGKVDPSRSLPEHDDWDCWYDLEEAGLIEDIGTGVNPRAKMTKRGLEIAGRLRAHKAGGGLFATFEVELAAHGQAAGSLGDAGGTLKAPAVL